MHPLEKRRLSTAHGRGGQAGHEPFHRLDLLHQRLVDERQDRGREGVLELLVFGSAVLGAVRRQPAGVDEVLERDLVGAIGDAERVVHALPAGAVLVGKCAERILPALRLLVLGIIRRVGVRLLRRRIADRQPEIGEALDDLARHVLAELHGNEGGHLVGGVLLASEHGHVQDVEDGVAGFVHQHRHVHAVDDFLTRDGDRKALRVLGHGRDDRVGDLLPVAR